jgi:Ca2+-binding EF-hand superfamily protein
MAEKITEKELETKVKSFKNKTTDTLVVRANQRNMEWFLTVTHTQEIEGNEDNEYKYNIKVRDNDREKGYTSLDVLAKRLKELGVEDFTINLS